MISVNFLLNSPNISLTNAYPEIKKEDLSSLKEKDVTLAETLDSANQGKEELKKENQQLKTELTNTLRLIDQYQKEKGQLNTRIIYLTDLNNQRQIEKEQLNIKLNQLMNLVIQKQTEIINLQANIAPLKSEIYIKNGQVQQVVQQSALMLGEMQNINRELNSKALEVEKLKTQIKKLEAEKQTNK